MTILHLVCGLPGAGKSTLAKRIEAETPAIRFTPDEWLLALGFPLYDAAARARVESLQWDMARQLLKNGINVVLENGFWVRDERERYRSEAGQLGAKVNLHFLNVPFDELKRRVVARNRLIPIDQHVNPDDIQKWYEAFETPTADELGTLPQP